MTIHHGPNSQSRPFMARIMAVTSAMIAAHSSQWRTCTILNHAFICSPLQNKQYHFLNDFARVVWASHGHCLHIRGRPSDGAANRLATPAPPPSRLDQGVRLVVPSPKLEIVNHSAHAKCTFLDNSFHGKLMQCSFTCFGAMVTMRSQLT